MAQISARDIRDISRTNTSPLVPPRSRRQVNQVVATSMPAGKMVLVTAFPLLREDKLMNSMIHCKVDLMETAEVIKNGIKCRFMAYFVPFLAFDRFNGGMDEFNRAYMKQQIADGVSVTPFFNSMTAGAVGSIPIHKHLGFHAAPTDVINTAYIEAYNTIWNFRARNRSESLYQSKKRLENATSLAPAFWQHEQYKYVVPDWDDQAMEGSVDLSFTNSQLAIQGLGLYGTTAAASSVSMRESDGTTNVRNAVGVSPAMAVAMTGTGAAAIPQIFANMATAGVKISLANIELAKRTQYYAELKAQFEGLDDIWIIDLLMQGVSVPEQMWKQPILIADKTEIFGIEKRWATDGANLTDAVVNGAAMCDLDMVLPQCPTGGIVMVVAEILPEQLFERARDPLMFTIDPAKLPNALRDDLDPRRSNG